MPQRRYRMQLSPMQQDILQELINIGVGRAANLLNQMTGSHITLKVPEIQILAAQEMLTRFDTLKQETVSAIRLGFDGSFSGTAALVFPPRSASNLITLIIGEEPVADDLDSMRVGTLQEIGNIVLNSVMGTFSNILGEHFNYVPPDYSEDSFENFVLGNQRSHGMVLMIRAHFKLEDKSIMGDLLIFFSRDTYEALLSLLGSSVPPEYQ